MGIKSLTKVTRTVLLLLLATVIVCSAAAIPQTGSSADPQVESVIKKLEGVEVDYSSYLNTSIYQPLPSSVRDDEEISVIITLPVVDLMDAYDASAKTMSMTDFALSADAAAITAEIAAQRDQTLALLDNMGVEYTVGELYDTLMAGFEIRIKAGDFQTVCMSLPEGQGTIVSELRASWLKIPLMSTRPVSSKAVTAATTAAAWWWLFWIPVWTPTILHSLLITLPPQSWV